MNCPLCSPVDILKELQRCTFPGIILFGYIISSLQIPHSKNLNSFQVNFHFNKKIRTFQNSSVLDDRIHQVIGWCWWKSASEDFAVRAILFGLFPIICSSNIQHDIFPNFYSLVWYTKYVQISKKSIQKIEYINAYLIFVYLIIRSQKRIPIFAFGDKFSFCAFWKDLFEPQIGKILIKFARNNFEIEIFSH